MRVPRRRGVARALLAAVVAVVAVGPFPAGPAAAAAPFEAVLAATTGLVDAQEVTLTLRGNAPAGWSYEARMCRGGIDYQTEADFPAVALLNRNCPEGNLGPSSSWAPVSGTIPAGPFEVAKPVTIATGTAAWDVYRADGSTNPDGTRAKESVTYTCDETSPCSLVVRMTAGSGLVGMVTIPLTFASEEQAAGCAGRAPGVLRRTSSYRMTLPLQQWNRLACQASPTQALPTAGSPGDEIDGLDAYSRGEADIAYTGMGLRFSEGVVPRSTVAVPVALNAAVLAVGNGYLDDQARVRPFGDVELTLEEVSLVLNSRSTTIALGEDRQALLQAVIERNAPQFGPLPGPGAPALADRGWFLKADAEGLGMLAQSVAEAPTWSLTRHLATNLGPAWKVWDGTADASGDTPRQTYTSFALAAPPFSNASTYTGSLASVRQKQLQAHTILQSLIAGSPEGVSNRPGGPIWVVTDLAQARQQNLSIVRIKRDRNSPAVAPTPASMAAAVAAMIPAEDGVTPVANPLAGAGPDGVEPYPLTFVEHAVAPMQQLFEPAGQGAVCGTPRSDSQQLLRDWLTLMVSPAGQQAAADAGYQPLTAKLSAGATALIDVVGALPGACPGAGDGPTVPELAPGSGGAGGSGGSGGEDLSATVTGFLGRDLGGSDFGAGGSTPAEDGRAPEEGASGPGGAGPPAAAGDDVAAPAYAGSRLPSALATGVATVFLVLLVVGASLATSGRVPWRRRAGAGGPAPSLPPGSGGSAAGLVPSRPGRSGP